MANRKIIPLAAMEKLMKKIGADRISEDAKEALSEVLEEKGIEIAEAAKKFSLHAGRKTIKAEDIKLAKK